MSSLSKHQEIPISYDPFFTKGFGQKVTIPT